MQIYSKEFKLPPEFMNELFNYKDMPIKLNIDLQLIFKTANVELIKKLGPPKNSTPVKWAAAYGNLEVLKYLIESGAEIDEYAMQESAKNGHLDIVKYLGSVNAPIDCWAIGYAAEKGHFEVVKYLLTIDTNVYPWVIANAAKNNHLELVKFLFGKVPIDYRAAESAAEYGHLEVLEYLVSVGAPITSSVISSACRKPYLDTVKYLVSIGTPFDAYATERAKVHSPELLEYLLYKDAPYQNCKITKKIKKKICLELKKIVSEFIGPDLTGLILQNLI